MNKDVKPSKKLKMAAGLVASAAAGTIAAMAYKVNEDKINAGIDKAADVTKNVIGKVSEKVKEVADDIMNMADEEQAAEEAAASGGSEVVDVEATVVEPVAAETEVSEEASTEKAEEEVK